MTRLYLLSCFFVLPLLVGCFTYVWQVQDTDLTLSFYEYFGVKPATALRGKVVWIAGASHGIGEYLAYEFINHGCKVVLSARRVEKLNQVKQNCLALAHQRDIPLQEDSILVVPLDLTNFESHENITNRVIHNFGKIDILLNFVGVIKQACGRHMSLEDDLDHLNTNFLGGVRLTKAVLPHMIRRKQGYIARAGSIWVKFGFPTAAMYSATAAASKAYYDALRLEMLHHNIKFTNYIIGSVETPWFIHPVTGENMFYKDFNPEHPDLIQVISMERFAHLAVTSLVNEMEEPWISRHPYLAVTYLSQYAPWFYRWYSTTHMMDWTNRAAKAVGVSPWPC